MSKNKVVYEVYNSVGEKVAVAFEGQEITVEVNRVLFIRTPIPSPLIRLDNVVLNADAWDSVIYVGEEPVLP